MGATYTRQSASAIVDGGVIEASDINAEFNQVLAAFAVTSGHTHDGTAAEGGPITKLLGTAITIGDATAGTDIALTFDGESNDGVLTWMEDEDYFKFSDDILMNSTERLNFGDTGTYIFQSTDGQLDIVADTEVQITATTIDINGAVDISGALTLAGTTLAETISDTVGAMVSSNTESGITVAYDDADNTLDFTVGTLNQDTTGNAATATALETARTIGGTSFDGSANIAVALAATSTALATARTIGGTSFDGTANIAVGLADTATALATARTIAGQSFNGSANITIASTDLSNTSNITLNDGTQTLTNKTLTSPKINEDVAVTSTATELNLLDGVSGLVQADFTKLAAVTSDATELNLLDGKAATNLALVGKQEGTNFTSSLLVGHATSGTLNAAEKNTGVGIESLDALTSGDRNVALGYEAGTAISTGSFNTAIGASALVGVTTASSNTGVGYNTLRDPTGGNNTAIGKDALKVNGSGARNIALGADAGENISTGSGNVIIGSVNAGSATGDRQLLITGNDGSTATTWISGDSNGVVTFADDIIIKDAGTIGSASDVDAIAIGADGDITLTQDLELQHDGAILSFGANDEVTLTHVHNDGLLLNTDMQLQFRDSAINIRSDADGDLDINADDEVEINSTLIDVNGNLDVSGTLAQAGVATFALAANVAQVALSSSSNAIAWDASAAANAYHVTTENTTFSAPSNAVEGAFICVEINYNGSHTIAFNTVFEFAASTAPTTTDTDGKTDILVFRYNGAVWQEVGRTLNLSES
ncbi:hypothetical protein N9Y58_01365 [Alphaproteobacteria bacterium]|nr:hypothetical protein [Alphaproteobacteria bacterium]